MFSAINLHLFQPFLSSTRCLCCTAVNHLFRPGWRERANLPRIGNEYGPLTDLPDWSYIDGRPGPLGVKQKKRYKERIAQAKKVVQLLKEVDFAVERHKQLKIEKKDAIEEIINNKLQPKGDKILDIRSPKPNL